MFGQPDHVQALAVVLAIVVVTAAAVRAVVFAIERSRPVLLLWSWIAAMTGGILFMASAPALVGDWHPLLSGALVMTVVHNYDLPLAALLVLGALAAAGLEMLSPPRRSRAAAARSGVIGAAGESLVMIELRQAGFPALHGVMLGGHGWSTEIDHVVRTAGSIVAIETKTLSGRVEGWPQSRQWVQRIGRREHWFLNPMRQNAIHLEAMRQAIGTIDVPLRGLVVIAGTAMMDEALCGCVVPVPDLAQVLRQENPGGGRGLDQAWSILERRAEQGGDDGDGRRRRRADPRRAIGGAVHRRGDRSAAGRRLRAHSRQPEPALRAAVPG